MSAPLSRRVSALGNGLQLAFGLLTALRVRRLPTVDRRAAGVAMLLAPVTAVPLLAVLWLGHVAARGAASPLLLAAVFVTAGVLYSRCMHLDGLADTADGLSAGYDAATSLRAMKASDVGPSGVAAVVLALLAQVSALSVLLPTGRGAVLAGVALVASRSTLVWSCRSGVPAAQPRGLGALVAGSVAQVPALAATAALLILAGAAALTGAGGWPGSRESAGPFVMEALLTAVAALLAGLLVRWRSLRRLGGITGDVLGAGIEIAATAALVTAGLVAH